MQPEHEESTLIIRLVAPPNTDHATYFYRFINDADDMASQDARDASKLPWKYARMVSNLNTSGKLWEYRLPPHLNGEWTRVASEKQLEYIIISDPESTYVLLQARHKDHAESTVKCQADLDSETAAQWLSAKLLHHAATAPTPPSAPATTTTPTLDDLLGTTITLHSPARAERPSRQERPDTRTSPYGIAAWRDSIIPAQASHPRTLPSPLHILPGTTATPRSSGSRTPPSTDLPPPQPLSPLHVFIFFMAFLARVIGLAPAETAYMASWESLLWFWITQGPVVGAVPYRYVVMPVPSAPRIPPTRRVPTRLHVPCRHLIHYVVLLLIIGGATDQWAHDPTKVNTAHTCSRTTRRHTMLHRRHARPLPWNMNNKQGRAASGNRSCEKVQAPATVGSGSHRLLLCS